MVSFEMEDIESFLDSTGDDICPFCGCDPFERVDVGTGGRGVPVAVTCCEHGIALYQNSDDGLTRAADKIDEARAIIANLVCELVDVHDKISKLERRMAINKIILNSVY